MNKTYIAVIGIVLIAVLYFVFSKGGEAVSKGAATFNQQTDGQSPEDTAKDLMKGINTSTTPAPEDQ